MLKATAILFKLRSDKRHSSALRKLNFQLLEMKNMFSFQGGGGIVYRVCLCTITIHVWKIDLITEQHHPLSKLYRSKDDSIRSSSVLTIMIESFQEQLRGGSTGEIQTNNLKATKYYIWG